MRAFHASDVLRRAAGGRAKENGDGGDKKRGMKMEENEEGRVEGRWDGRRTKGRRIWKGWEWMGSERRGLGSRNRIRMSVKRSGRSRGRGRGGDEEGRRGRGSFTRYRNSFQENNKELNVMDRAAKRFFFSPFLFFPRNLCLYNCKCRINAATTAFHKGYWRCRITPEGREGVRGKGGKGAKRKGKEERGNR